ncbi:TadE/TadG family type IV pilus assembly protein [Hyphomicrobium sp. 99]|uniref:TadE/TadG family type IV pilus assembly protein n=1 Tax=Hyphomicrobium sp. 99 TaxID=1163419 RepID=UPI001FD95C91|nr:TadE/TadG family type IV pilus assembly protein [Hyphomicrobium sp. 99]
MISRFRHFLRDHAGVAAVEFAFLAPLLMLMTFGTFEITRALIIHQRFQKATGMIGDLVAREQQLGADPTAAAKQLDSIMKAAEHAMAPYSSGPLQMGIYQFRASSTDATKTRIEWSYAYHNMAIQPCSLTYTSNNLTPANLLSKGDAAIIIDAKYQYSPLLTNLLPAVIKKMDWTDRMTFAPRFGSVFYGQATQNTTCPT